MNPETKRRLLPFFVTRPMWGLLPVRLTFGITLLVHGASRLLLMHGAHGSFIEELPGQTALVIFITFSTIEFLSGLLIIPGVGARIIGFSMMIELIVSIFSERIPLGFQGNLGIEMLLFSIASMLFFSGAGRFSVDRLIARRLLEKHPNKKWECYCIAETPHCNHWYE